MKMEEISARWLTETGRIICLIENEFIMLQEKHLDYRIHIGGCNIRQIIQQIVQTNRRLIAMVEQSIPLVKVALTKQEYNPGLFERIMLSRIMPVRCRSGNHKNNHTLTGEANAEMLKEIIAQQHKIKALIECCSHLDMNAKVVPLRGFGFIKFSLAGTLEYLLLNQKSRFLRARHIRMLQQ